MKMIAKDTKSRCRGGQDRQTPSSRRKPGPTDLVSERLTIDPGFPGTKSGGLEADPRARNTKNIVEQGSEVFQLLGSSAKLHDAYGWEPRMNLRSGVQAVLDWMESRSGINVEPRAV